MKVVILDAGTLGEDISLSPICDTHETQVHLFTSPDQIEERTKGFDVVVTNKLKLNKSTLGNSLPKLICVTLIKNTFLKILLLLQIWKEK